MSHSVPHTLEARAKMSATLRVVMASPEVRAKISAAKRGQKYPPRSPEHREKIRLNKLGAKSNLWRGGKPTEERTSDPRYYPWKRAVHKRDAHTCQSCGQTQLRARNEQADHVMAWVDAPDMRFEVWNGRTLCAACHMVRSLAQRIERYRYA